MGCLTVEVVVLLVDVDAVGGGEDGGGGIVNDGAAVVPADVDWVVVVEDGSAADVDVAVFDWNGRDVDAGGGAVEGGDVDGGAVVDPPTGAVGSDIRARAEWSS